MSHGPEPAGAPGHFAKVAALLVAAGLVLWLFISATSLLAICGSHLAS